MRWDVQTNVLSLDVLSVAIVMSLVSKVVCKILVFCHFKLNGLCKFELEAFHRNETVAVVDPCLCCHDFVGEEHVLAKLGVHRAVALIFAGACFKCDPSLLILTFFEWEWVLHDHKLSAELIRQSSTAALESTHNLVRYHCSWKVSELVLAEHQSSWHVIWQSELEWHRVIPRSNHRSVLEHGQLSLKLEYTLLLLC